MTLAHRPAVHSDRDATRSPDLLARLLAHGRPLVMGVLNVTPDSFSDGGRFLDPGAAIEQAHRMVAEPQARFAGVTTVGIVEEILTKVPSPS